MPQFHSRVVVAVHKTPLMASATQAVALTWAKGGGWTGAWVKGLISQGPRTQRASITVPERMVYAVTTGGLWDNISFLLSRIQASAVKSEATTIRSPTREGSPRAAGPRLPPRTMSAAPSVE